MRRCHVSLPAALAAFCLAAVPLPAQQAPIGRPEGETEEQYAARMAWWREARFGLFIHWGPVSLKGTEIGWSRGGERPGLKGTGEVPVEEYDNLYKRFNPVRFDADEWVRIARDAGQKYLVFTSKHHDGFVNFDTQLTDYKITSPDSPFRRDIVGELAAACRRGGLRFGLYYSPPDWHHPDFRRAGHQRYLEYFHGQLRELCTNYGKIDIIWFDGLDCTAEELDSVNLLAMIRRLQPGVIINNRAGLPADHDTPEQTIGGFRDTRPWESCMTICRQWAWKPDDEMKSLRQCLQTLVRVAGGDGNLLFNVGPTPEGEIEGRQAERLREMGCWLQRYGRSIYGTRGGPYCWTAPGPAPVVSTRRDRTVWLHVLEWPAEGDLVLPPLPAAVASARLMTGGWCEVKQTPEAWTVVVPRGHRQEIDTIVELQLDTLADGIRPVKLGSPSLATGAAASASNVFAGMPDFGPDMAVDDDINTRWATDAGTSEAELVIDLGEPKTVGRAVIIEAIPGRVRRFRLQTRGDGDWQTVHTGEGLGHHAEIRFEPVQARHVRLRILQASEGPTISEFQLFER